MPAGDSPNNPVDGSELGTGSGADSSVIDLGIAPADMIFRQVFVLRNAASLPLSLLSLAVVNDPASSALNGDGLGLAWSFLWSPAASA